MPLLDRTGLKNDLFVRAVPDDALSQSHVLVGWADLPDALTRRSRDQRIGVEVANDINATELWPVLRQISLIAIHFPTYADGRGFSLARQLRNQGFDGTLRAVGPLIADQFAYALACGFDEVEPPLELLNRQPPVQWLKSLGHISHSYQRGYGDASNILDQRRVARSAAKDTAS
jgi:uncharacterized protein (DUF934 family)